jgi:DDE superfamily endonuclease
LREFYRAQVAEILAEEAIFVDKSAVNERTKDRKRGWSPRGVPCRVTMLNGRLRRWSILPAIGINGYLDYEIYYSSFNSKRFNNFIRRLLLKMNLYSRPRSVLIIDNYSAYYMLVSLLTPYSLLVLIIAFRSFKRCVNRQAFN